MNSLSQVNAPLSTVFQALQTLTIEQKSCEIL